jgi:LDH2 family malate/lactate/ureidoglycolate dehydrogenase
MGCHEGYGLALMAPFLGATLTGGSFSPLRGSRRTQADEPDEPDIVGHFFMAIDPRTFRPPSAFEDDLDAVIDVLHATPAADRSRRVLVPGEPEDLDYAERLIPGPTDQDSCEVAASFGRLGC